MASFRLVFQATATITVLFILSIVNARAQGGVGVLCKHTDYPALCNSIVKGGHGAAGATKSSIYATILQTRAAKSMANTLTQSLTSQGKASLDVCNEVYDDAISNLVESLKNLKDKDKATLMINLSAAMSDFGTCDDGFNENPGSTSPFVKVNVLLHELTSNSLALASTMKH